MSALRSDAEVRQSIIDAFEGDARIAAGKIVVDVTHGFVVLRGTVATSYARRLAGDVAARVKGVQSVRNEIQAAGESGRTDAEIASEVGIDLAHSADLAQQPIEVEVRGGTVYLRGTVQSIEQKLLADEIAWWTAGVRDVINELVVASQPSPPPSSTPSSR